MADSSDLDRLVLEHLPAALRFAVRMTGDSDAAEELVQDALVRVAKRFRSFRNEATFRTWLFRILINAFRDRLRRRAAATLPLDEEAFDLADAKAVAPLATLAAEELARRVAYEVSRLPPRQREVMVLTVYEGLTISEAAEVLGITEQNVHATVSAARARLKIRLAGYLGLAEK